MASYSVKLKWNKEVFDNVVVVPSKGAVALMDDVERLTGVPVARQKVMCKDLWKGTLKGDQEIEGLPWKDGVLIGMMGTSTGLPQPPEEKTVFVEDMSTKEKLMVAAADPPGLANLGNTCFLNATVQCLRAAPELRSALDAAPLSNASNDIAEKMVLALRNTFHEMDGNDKCITPFQFVQTMRLTYPNLAQQDQRGGYAQQDADEFYGLLMNDLQRKLTKATPDVDFGQLGDAVSALFGIDVKTTMKCIENDAEPPNVGNEMQRRLQCNITSDVVTIEEGVSVGLQSEVEKQSPTLNRNALYKVTRRISRLPKYLTVQENRFYWKRREDGQGGVSCKILKQVKFAPTLDVFDFCDPELQAILKGPRDKHLNEKMGRGEGNDGAQAESAAKAADNDADMADADEELKAALKMSMMETDSGASGKAAGLNLPKDFRGIYELFGIVTHKGRDSDSGHYVGWTRGTKGNGWVCFDDETASACSLEDVLLLSGGGDREMAYMFFYRAKE